MNHHNDSYIIQQNNAGVDCFMRRFDYAGALNHFRQALSTKLASEQRVLNDQPMYMIVNPNENRSFDTNQRCVTPEPYDDEKSTDSCMEYSLAQSPIETTSTSCPNSGTILEAPSFQDVTDIYHIQLNIEENFSNTKRYIPYLYLNTFLLADSGIETNHSLSVVHVATGERKLSEERSHNSTVSIQSIMMSTVIVLNLGILYHTIHRSSAKAAAFYEVAMSLLHTLPPTMEQDSLFLQYIVLNNYGVWCYENHDIDTMIHCFEEINHLLKLLEVDDRRNDSHGNVTSTFDVSIKDGIRRNLTEFLI